MNARYVVKRLLQTVIVLFVVITLIFFLPRMIFDDPVKPFIQGIPEDEVELIQKVREEYGFDKPVIVQYFIYLGKVLTLDFGYSHIYKEEVFNVMFSRIPWSLVLSLSSMVISCLLGIVIGAKVASKRGKWQDNTLLSASTVTTALPAFWLALVFVMLFAFAIPIFPYGGGMTQGYLLRFNAMVFWIIFAIGAVLGIVLAIMLKKGWPAFVIPLIGAFIAVIAAIPVGDTMDVLYHALLPVLVVCIGSTVSYAVMVRNSMIAVVNEDYILTARAKGLPSKKVLFRHTFRNSLLPLVTNIGMSLAGVFGGSVLIEKIFSWPGMGQLLLEANNTGDFQLAQAIMLFFAILTIIANLVTDMVYHKLDPRVKVS